MNKLLGFYELRDSSLPVVPWKEYNPKTTKFKGNNLWTIRTALNKGNDVNLPKRAEFFIEISGNYCKSMLYLKYRIIKELSWLLSKTRKGHNYGEKY